MSRFSHLIFTLILFLSLFSCATHKQHAPIEGVPPAPAISTSPLPDHSPLQQNQISQKRKTIVHYAIQSIGTAYKWGGQTPYEGFDCSGLIVYTHKKADIIVPRVTSKQLENGRVVSLSDIQPADLVFFNNPNKNQGLHVGVYIGNGQFIHSPGKGRNVLAANLNNTYFKKNYIGSRRFVH